MGTRRILTFLLLCLMLDFQHAVNVEGDILNLMIEF